MKDTILALAAQKRARLLAERWDVEQRAADAYVRLSAIDHELQVLDRFVAANGTGSDCPGRGARTGGEENE